ncbi:diaminopimelate epimerase [Alkalihalobacterium alkalinitrilicum]|uniref:diaminopimelate epimerase n=1 Tax=Alkalihalobacterium alkalinitrilicum TaxID=427920 RepID=UPI000995565E|nr:diaminopimelate epimerase [Alkalihalobacterium alkalinitrilicum]
MKFTKMHGLGNSYIYVDLFQEVLKEEELPQLAIEVADKNKGIGSDGMILVCPSEVAPVKMRVFNNDGSEAKNCGNGLRCVAKFAYEHGYVKEPTFQIETLGGLVEATVHVSDNQVKEVTVNMGQPRLQRKDLPMTGNPEEQVIAEPLERNGYSLEMTAVSMGNPHAVFFVDQIDEAPVETLGPVLEKDEIFPEWVNVEFVEAVNADELHFRVWERGSGITQACGTGACAAVVAAVLNEKVEKGKEIIVHLLGGDLKITWTVDGDVLMTGAAETVCTGEYFRK